MLDLEETVTLKEINFRMAFTLENYLTQETTNDPRYIRWIVRMYGRNNGEWYEDILPFHKCTEEDFKEFSKIDQLSIAAFREMLNKENRGFYCLDEWPDDMMLGGDKTA